jgi:flagellar transcriptional activator FlhC
VKFVNNNMLGRTQCCKCGGHFVTNAYENARHFECGLCTPPARAGKSAAAGGILLH